MFVALRCEVGNENDSAADFVLAIGKGMDSKQQKQQQLDMVVVVVPNDNKTRYDAVKKFCCFDRSVPTQVIRAPTLANPKVGHRKPCVQRCNTCHAV